MWNLELGIRNGGFFGGFFEAHICRFWALSGKLGSSCVNFGCSILQGKCKAGNRRFAVVGDHLSVSGVKTLDMGGDL